MSTRPDSPNLAPPLSAVLLSSAEVVESVLDGRSLTDALADVESSLRPAVQAVSFHAMRYLGWADAVGRELVQRYRNKLSGPLLDRIDLEVPMRRVSAVSDVGAGRVPTAIARTKASTEMCPALSART